MPATRNRYDSAFAAFARGCALWYSDEASVASFTGSRATRNCDNSAIAAFPGRSTRRHHNHTAIAPFAVEWNAFVLSRTELALHKVANWTRIQGAGFVHYEIGGRGPADAGWARALLGVEEGADWLEYKADTTGTYRAAHVAGGRLQSCVFVAHGTLLPARGWLAGLFAQAELAQVERATLLAGRAARRGPDPGLTVCSCFGVGRNTICAAIREQGLETTAQVTSCVKAGGNCGSCVPEIGKLLALARSFEGGHP